MENKRFHFRYLIALAFLALPFFFQNTQAAYDCNVDYSGGTAISSAALNACCYPASAEPYGGISCRPEGTFLQQIGGVVTCTDEPSLVAKATSQKSKNRKLFNCFTGATPATCRDNYCPQVGTGTCIPTTGTVCPASKNRVNLCPGACGSCNADSVYCPVPSEGPKDPGFDVGPNYAAAEQCQLKKYGPTTTNPNDPQSCANQGKSVANFCTGECTGCAAGYTESGRNLGACIPFAQRFIQIFEDGLTFLGGYPYDPNNDGITDDFDNDGRVEENAYDYSKTGPGRLAEVFLKADMAETLNWNSEYLPKQLRWLLNNVNLCTVDSDCPNASQVCGPGGICSTPGAGAGIACSLDSDCDIVAGYECDFSTGTCQIPGTGGAACSSDAQCTVIDPSLRCSQQTAGGFCYAPGNKSSCTQDQDCDLLQGFTCNLTTNKCEPPNPSPVKAEFVGLSGTPLTGNRGGYLAVDSICNAVYEGSHVCDSGELINSYLVNAPALTGETGIGWFNSAAPGNIIPLVSDCKGWANEGDDPYYSTVWNFTLGASAIQPCSALKEFACCR